MAISSYSLYLGSLILLAVWYAVGTLFQSTSKLPGPWYSKWTAIWLKYHWIKGDRSVYVHRLHETYGPIVRIAPDEVSIVDVDAAKTIYNTKETFKKAKFYRNFVAGQVENVFSTTNVDVHRRFRRLLANPMSETSLKTMTERVHDRVSLTMEKMKTEMEERGATDVFKWWLFMATDIIGELTFGDSFRMLERGESNDYAATIQSTSSLGAIRSTFPILVQWAGVLPIKALTKAREDGFKLFQYADQSIRRYHGILEKQPDLVKQTLFTNVFKAEDNETLSMNEIRANSISYLIAGSDTTANTLTYLVWNVCQRPDIKKRLVDELKTLPDSFTETDLRDLKYLTHVIDEALRLHGAVQNAMPRAVPEGGASFLGHYLDQGTTVSCQGYSMHRIEAVYPDAEEFDPSRWETPTRAMKDAFMAFGKGSRNCLGLHLARIELRLAAAMFFIKFPDSESSALEGMSNEDMKPSIFFITNPKGRRCLIEAK